MSANNKAQHQRAVLFVGRVGSRIYRPKRRSHYEAAGLLLAIMVYTRVYTIGFGFNDLILIKL